MARQANSHRLIRNPDYLQYSAIRKELPESRNHMTIIDIFVLSFALSAPQ
jgi:hypothetical protein